MSETGALLRWTTCLLLAVTLFPAAARATRVVFFPAASGAEASEPREVEDGADSDLCRRRNPLAGLEMTRELVGVPTCANSEARETNLSQHIDLLVLVDDTRGLGEALDQRINSVPGRTLTCQAASRRRVFPSYLTLGEGADRVRVLLVGEGLIASYFSEDPGNSEPWQRHLERIIARQQGTDASPDSGISPSVNSYAANGIPAGKGLFNLRPLRRLVDDRHKPYKMDHMASRFRDNGLNWFALVAGAAARCEGALYAEYLRFGRPNFQTFVWSLNVPDDLDAQVDELIRGARSVRASGIIIDIEGAFNNHAAEARQLYAKAREAAAAFEAEPGGWPLSVGITVIGFPTLRDYLTIDDLRDADFVMPQIYNRGDSLSENALIQRIEFWQTTLPDQRVILLAGAQHCTVVGNRCESERAKTAEELEAAFAPFRTRARESIGWWRYGNIESGNHWQVIRDFDLPMGPTN